MTLEVYLLGDMQLGCDGTPLQLPATLRACSLLAYLVSDCQRSHPRERLAALFWPDRPRAKALHSLSTALWHIRRVLPPGDYILADAKMLQFNPQSDYWSDVEAFLTFLSADEPDIEALQQAVKLYRGDLLEGYYDDWILNSRYRL